jgi:pyruvate/2-oxoglutarate dehydrogenase complex dihydrolipoamide dehydrogenase (E3) component
MVNPVTIAPMDVHNQFLISQVHPNDWINPEPVDRYDLVVIGAGTAGLVVAAGAAGLGLGLKVAIVERDLMGGDCLNVGCVPSKTMIRSSRIAAEIRGALSFGIQSSEVEVDFAAVMERVRRIRAGISDADSAQRFQKLGVDVFLGEAHFVDAQTIAVADKSLRFKKAVIATGARASQPEIPGLREAGYLTNETVFSLTERPRRLGIIGGGAIGCEFAQTFQRLGCKVVLLHKNDHILDREDNDAAEIIQQTFIREGVKLFLQCTVERVEKTPEGKVIYFKNPDGNDCVTVDEILIGVGRSPNVEELNLEAIGVEYDKRGIKVNDYLQTTNPKIYAAGDICMNWKFTHAADAAARIVIKNTLFSPFGLGRSKLSNLVMPWATYTDPEVAHVGMYEPEIRAKGLEFDTIKIPFEKVDRAIADGETDGFVKILHKKGSDQILGATIVARHAGDLISEVTLAIVGKRGLNTLSGVIHPYPTQAEAIKKAADAYRRTLLTPNSKRLLGFLTKLS